MAPSKMTILSFRRFFSAAIRVALGSKDSLPSTGRAQTGEPRPMHAIPLKKLPHIRQTVYRRGQ